MTDYFAGWKAGCDPGAPMTRYGGVFCATQKLRSRVVPKTVDLRVVTGSRADAAEIEHYLKQGLLVLAATGPPECSTPPCSDIGVIASVNALGSRSEHGIRVGIIGLVVSALGPCRWRSGHGLHR